MRGALVVFLMISVAGVSYGETGAGLRWTGPTVWKAQPARPMRLATYSVPAAAGDREDGECGIYYFGRTQGGSIEANLKRWIAQFGQPEHEAQIQKRTINGVHVTTVDVSGTYTGAGGPMATSKSAKPGYRLLGAIVEAPEGLVFVKFTAPTKTLAANQKSFDSLLQSLAPEL